MCQNQFHDFPYLLPTLNEKKSGENFVFFFWGKELRCDHYHQWVRAAQWIGVPTFTSGETGSKAEKHSACYGVPRISKASWTGSCHTHRGPEVNWNCNRRYLHPVTTPKWNKGDSIWGASCQISVERQVRVNPVQETTSRRWGDPKGG